MAKSTTVFFCKECGFESAKWMGQCPGCHAWNTFTEEPVRKSAPASPVKRESRAFRGTKSVYIRDIDLSESKRIPSGMEELDRVLGGGIVPGSLVLLGGDPGIGKSTILLQVCRYLSEHGTKVLYISGEESLQQVKMRAVRMGEFTGDMKLASETNLSDIEELMREEKPEVAVIDSIQTMYREDITSAPGSVSQVRECTNALLQIAKQDGVMIFLVGHVTKEGTVAGPRVLEHMVDTVLYFEGERSMDYRLIRAVKNRFGATNEVGVFEMTGEGLKEVPNPSDYMLSGRPEQASGSVVTCVMEGTRPMLLEIQALVSKTSFGLPRRTSVGIDYNRVNLLIAVLEKRAGLPLYEYDCYVNITGGMKISEPGIDLAIVMVLASGLKDAAVPDKMIVFGETGLAGEVRGVSQPGVRVREAVKLGYERCVVPEANRKGIEKNLLKYCVFVRSVREAVGLLK